MRRHFSSLFFVISVITLTVLVACTSTVSISPTSTITPPDTVLAATPTDIPMKEEFPGEFSECVVSSSTAAQEEDFTFPTPLTPDHALGNQIDPEITLIVYTDMQCPYCAAFQPVINQLLDEYPDELQVIYRHLPLFMVHDKAFIAAQALEAVALQNEEVYFLLQDELLANQSEWEALTPEKFSAYLRTILPTYGIEMDQFDEDMMNEEYNQNLFSDLDAAIAAGIALTPYVFLNDQPYSAMSRDITTFRTVIELELLVNRQYETCPPLVIEQDAAYIAILHTTKGDITLKLYGDAAPLAVNNFIFLAQEGWYDENPFYSVIPDEFALTGDPTGSSLGTPGYTFRNEIDTDLTFDRAGVVAMNNAGSPNSNGSQFFITFGAMPELDGKFTIFGQVIEGIDVLNELAERNPSADNTNQYFDQILSVTIVE